MWKSLRRHFFLLSLNQHRTAFTMALPNAAADSHGWTSITVMVFFFESTILRLLDQAMFKVLSQQLQPSKHSSWWRRLEDVLKMSLVFVFRRRLQDVFIKINIFVMVIHLQDIFKTSSRRFQDVFKTFSRRPQDIFKTPSRCIIKLNCSW